MSRFFVALLILLTIGCRQTPKPVNYRRLEVFSPSRKMLEFGFIVRMSCTAPWNAPLHEVPWHYEVDLDTTVWCLCGARAYVFKTSPEPGRLRILLRNREAVILDTFADVQYDKVMLSLSRDYVWPFDLESERRSVQPTDRGRRLTSIYSCVSSKLYETVRDAEKQRRKYSR